MISEDGFEINDAIRVSTIHQSKGREFPIVFIADVAQRIFPGDYRPKKFYVPDELAKGFGFFQSKPHSALGKYALSVDWIKNATLLPQVNCENSRVSANMIIELNGERVGKINTAQEMTFSFARLIEHAAKTRTLSEGTLIGSGTVSSSVSMDGFACLLERNAVFNDKPELYLKHGDRITMYIEGLKETLIIDQRIA